MAQTLLNTGWWSENFGGSGEAPAQVIVEYLGVDGRDYWWVHNFLIARERQPVMYFGGKSPEYHDEGMALKNYTLIPGKKWGSYKIDLLGENLAGPDGITRFKSPAIVRRIHFRGSGWDFGSAVRDIELVGTPTPLGKKLPPDFFTGKDRLLIAAEYNQIGALRRLLASGADVNQRSSSTATALMAAAMNGHTDAVKLLLDHGADVNAQHQTGQTALIWATEYGYMDEVKLLLRKKADQEMRDNRGETALSLAAKLHYVEIEQMLEKAEKGNVR